MIFRITDFDDGPHPDVALIDAPTEDHARRILAERLAADDGDGTVWNPLPERDWSVSLAPSPVIFLLGGGCR